MEEKSGEKPVGVLGGRAAVILVNNVFILAMSTIKFLYKCVCFSVVSEPPIDLRIGQPWSRQKISRICSFTVECLGSTNGLMLT